MKNTLILEGLSCANCAAKIEQDVRKLREVRSVTLDYISKKLTYEADPAAAQLQLRQRIEGIIGRIEPDVSVVSADSSGAAGKEAKEPAQNMRLLKLIIGSALLALAMLLTLPAWLELFLYVASYLVLGGSVVLRAVKSMARGQVFTEHFLMSIATIGAFVIGEYAEGAAVMLFYLVGEFLEDKAVGRSRRSITALTDIRPEYANLKQKSELKRVAPQAVRVGDEIVVKPGERIPLDGRVIKGSALVDTSALTGESLPRFLEPGMEALSGFVNQNGILTLEVTKSYQMSTVSKILELVENVSSRKAPTETLMAKFARVYTPAVVLGALALALIPPLIIPGADFSAWVYRALVFLVVSCPCALVISIPLGFFGGIGGASKRGILIKGGNYLEALSQVETVVFDKTGTLTKGAFALRSAVPRPGFTREELIQAAAYAESCSNHPIAQSIVKAFPAEVDKDLIEHYEEAAGLGVRIRVRGRDILAGSKRLLQSQGIACVYGENQGTVVHVAIDGAYAGHLLITDEIKEDAVQTIRSLKALGIKRTLMFTGDLQQAGEETGRLLELDKVYTDLLPGDKVALMETLMKEKTGKGRVVFVGDGINDAPVLARADVGIAMGALGSDAAIEAADVVIMTDEPSKVVTAIRIAGKTRRIVYQNIVFALGVKALFLALGAAGVTTMWAAVFGDMGVALIAIMNSLRALNTKKL